MHPHRGFDNLWYVLEGAVSTGHSTGPDAAMERAHMSEGALGAAGQDEACGMPMPSDDELAEGQADAESSVLFWVNLARKDKQAQPSAQVLQPEQIATRQEGDATVRVLVGEGSPASRDARAHPRRRAAGRRGGHHTVPPEFQGFAYVLEGEAAFGANRRRAKPPQLVLLGRGDELGHGCRPGTRYLLLAGQPYGEVPIFNGPYSGLGAVFGLDERIAASADGASIWVILAVAVLPGLRSCDRPGSPGRDDDARRGRT